MPVQRSDKIYYFTATVIYIRGLIFVFIDFFSHLMFIANKFLLI